MRLMIHPIQILREHDETDYEYILFSDSGLYHHDSCLAGKSAAQGNEAKGECDQCYYCCRYGCEGKPRMGCTCPMRQQFEGSQSETSPPDQHLACPPHSPAGKFWHEWFDRLGDRATPDVINATANLVCAEKVLAATPIREAVAEIQKYNDHLEGEKIMIVSVADWNRLCEVINGRK